MRKQYVLLYLEVHLSPDLLTGRDVAVPRRRGGLHAGVPAKKTSF